MVRDPVRKDPVPAHCSVQADRLRLMRCCERSHTDRHLRSPENESADTEIIVRIYSPDHCLFRV